MHQRIRQSKHQGQGLVEYALILLFVAAVVVVALPAIGSALVSGYELVGAAL
ncbi:MAG TPA: hypothetical protein VFV93_03610 [Thermomicrobiales bacterium]|nr:hypothetical protein [Thermomicrobiales bacterium]